MKKQFLITKIGKHLFYAMLAVCIFGGLFCLGCNDIDGARYKKGDVVYLRPDSTKAKIVSVNRFGLFYTTDLGGVERYDVY